MQKELNVEAQDVAALSRTQTVGEVVDAMIKEIGGAGAAPAAAAAPSAPAAAAAPSSAPRGVSPAKATEVVLAVLAAKTGYEPDMIEMDMALETELGVDSIKRVEILSEVQKPAQRRGAGRRRALAHADRRRGRRGDDQGARRRRARSAGVAAAAPSAPAAACRSAGRRRACRRRRRPRSVLAVLAAKTGYEPDMIEMDMALETELGVDSIKRVEILSTCRRSSASRRRTSPRSRARRRSARSSRR